MKEYFISLLAASVLITLFGMLAPEGGISKHLRLLLALFLVCAVISPLSSLIGKIDDWKNGDVTFPWDKEEFEQNYEQQRDEALAQASRDYFRQSLTQMLEREFSIAPGNVECHIEWSVTESGKELPQKITVLLSNGAIWKDPKKIQAFIVGLLSCECAVALK